MNLMSDETVRIVGPQELTIKEFAAVREFILEGGEVGAINLSEYLKSSSRVGRIVEMSNWCALLQSKQHDLITSERFPERAGIGLMPRTALVNSDMWSQGKPAEAKGWQGGFQRRF